MPHSWKSHVVVQLYFHELKLESTKDNNQLTVICKTRVKRILNSKRCQKEMCGTKEPKTFSILIVLE